MKLFRILLITIISFLLISGCKKSPPTESDDPIVVTFSDLQFETLIREILSIPTGDIMDSDMKTIYELSGIELEITSIDGIEYCENITYLRIRNNQISDISPLVQNQGIGSGDIIWLNLNP